MFNRKTLKNQAKAILKTSYWKAFLVSLLTLFATGSCGSGSGSSYNATNVSNANMNMHNDFAMGNAPDFSFIFPYLPIIITVFLMIMAVAICFSVFVLNPLLVGCQKYFIFASKGDASLDYVGNGFKKPNYKNVTLTMFLTNLYLFLWFLLLIIPGIIKSYAYRMVPYILAENPGMKPSEAIKLSCQITKGYKWKLFVLDLSFIGWFLLGLLAFVIGTLFVYPYYFQTVAQSYMLLRYGDRARADEHRDLEYIVEA